jgi:phenylpropionate dioxygenase-like ring-hydroxylating dioxygenase large terminal subunit
MPLAEYLEAVPDDIAWVGLDEFRCNATVTTPVRANWKVIVDGFSETYHVQGLHPELLGSIDDIDAPQKVWGHTSKSEQNYGVPSPRFRKKVPDVDVWTSFIVTQGSRMGIEEPCPLPPLEPGQTVQDLIAQRIRDAQAATGVDLSRFDTEQIMRMHQYNLFPNATVLVTPDLLSVLCGRPGPTPDEAEFVAFSYRREPSAAAARTKPVDVVLPADQLDMGLVLNADVRVLEGMQRGLHQPALTHLTLSGEECRVINTHNNLERYLAQP